MIIKSALASSHDSDTFLTEENERLKNNEIVYETPSGKQTMPNLVHLDGEAAVLYQQIEGKIKADTVRKMQNELKKTFSALCKGEMSDLFRIIDQIAKEMLEGNL